MKKIVPILVFVLITSLVVILVLSVKSFWPTGWPGAAQATLGAAITAGVVSILGIYLKFIFDQISSETAYNRKISEKMISKVYIYSEKYYIPIESYAEFSALKLNDILTNANASTQEKQLALFFITNYFRYLLKLITEKGGLIFLKNFDSESYLEELNIRARRNLELTTDQICILQKSIALEDTPRDFSIKIQGDNELNQIYETIENWLKDNSKVKKTITYLHCYSELMRHELNTIYRPWYQKKPPQISHDCKEVLRHFKEFKKLELKKDKKKISKNEYEEKKEEEENNLNNSISGFFKD